MSDETEQKKLNARAVGAFLSAVAISIREVGGRKEGYLLRRLTLHLDSAAEEQSPLSGDDRAHLTVIRGAFQKYLSDPQLKKH